MATARHMCMAGVDVLVVNGPTAEGSGDLVDSRSTSCAPQHLPLVTAAVMHAKVDTCAGL
eukprot:6818454-Prymnesium_polylepis.1